MRLQAEFRHIHQEQGFLINTTVPLEFLHLEMGQVFMSHQRYTLIVFNETNLPTKYPSSSAQQFFY